MVFWSSFAKKVKQAVSQVAFDLLKNRVNSVEQVNQSQDTKINANQQNITQLQTTSSQHTQSINANTNNITTLDNKVDSVITGLQNGNIVNYTGPYNNSKNYNLAEATTYQDKWYVSNIDNNMGHTPSGSSDQYWELLSEPTINLNPYLTKSEASNTYLLKTMLNTLYPVGSVIMTVDNTTHALVNMFPGKLQELTDTDIAYLAIGTNSSNSNTGTFRINQNNLPNIYWNWNWYWNNGITSNETDFNINHSQNMTSTYQYIQTNKKNASQANNSGARVNVNSTIYLNGNVNQSPITYTIKPKTLKIRMWKVIANLI